MRPLSITIDRYVLTDEQKVALISGTPVVLKRYSGPYGYIWSNKPIPTIKKTIAQHGVTREIVEDNEDGNHDMA